MFSKDKADNVIKYMKNDKVMFWDYDQQVATPFMDAVGGDRKGLEQYLSNLSLEDLNYAAGIFEYVYEKWMDEDMWDFLDGLERKLKDAGYQPY